MNAVKRVLWGLLLFVVILTMGSSLILAVVLVAYGLGVDPGWLWFLMIMIGFILWLSYMIGPDIEQWVSLKLKNWRGKGS